MPWRYGSVLLCALWFFWTAIAIWELQNRCWRYPGRSIKPLHHWYYLPLCSGACWSLQLGKSLVLLLLRDGGPTFLKICTLVCGEYLLRHRQNSQTQWGTSLWKQMTQRNPTTAQKLPCQNCKDGKKSWSQFARTPCLRGLLPCWALTTYLAHGYEYWHDESWLLHTRRGSKMLHPMAWILLADFSDQLIFTVIFCVQVIQMCHAPHWQSRLSVETLLITIFRMMDTHWLNDSNYAWHLDAFDLDGKVWLTWWVLIVTHSWRGSNMLHPMAWIFS